MSFLVATEGTHHFLSASTLFIPYQDYLYLKNNINSFRNNTDDRKWQAILINDTEYLIKSRFIIKRKRLWRLSLLKIF